VQYADLFIQGTLSKDYSGGCRSCAPETTLRLCADLVMRNSAPFSWLFGPLHGGLAVYFHNTMSFGVCLPHSSFVEATTLVNELDGLGFRSHLIS
jgi:hypothetical protein